MTTFKKYLFILIGSISLMFGVIGIFLPLLPTTPFLLLSAYLFAKSSGKLHQWLITHRKLGPYIINYTEHKSMDRKTKKRTIVLLWTTMIISMLIVNIIYATITLIIIATLVTIHLLSLETI